MGIRMPGQFARRPAVILNAQLASSLVSTNLWRLVSIFRDRGDRGLISCQYALLALSPAHDEYSHSDGNDDQQQSTESDADSDADFG